MLRGYLSIVALLAATAASVAGNPGAKFSGSKAGHSPARRHPFVQPQSNAVKRDSNARFTWYVIDNGNQVACGGYRGGGDYVVALNSCEFGGYPSPNCGRGLTISYGGRSTHAVVADECPTCPCGGLDLTAGLFSFFADQGAGELYGDWWWDGDGPSGGDPPPPPPPPPPETTQQQQPTPTTSDPVLTIKTASTSSTSTATPSPSPTPQVIHDLNLFAIQLEQLILVASKLNR